MRSTPPHSSEKNLDLSERDEKWLSAGIIFGDKKQNEARKAFFGTPKGPIFEVFKLLSPTDLARVAAVSRKTNAMIQLFNLTAQQKEEIVQSIKSLNPRFIINIDSNSLRENTRIKEYIQQIAQNIKLPEKNHYSNALSKVVYGSSYISSQMTPVEARTIILNKKLYYSAIILGVLLFIGLGLLMGYTTNRSDGLFEASAILTGVSFFMLGLILLCRTEIIRRCLEERDASQLKHLQNRLLENQNYGSMREATSLDEKLVESVQISVKEEDDDEQKKSLLQF